MGKQGKDVDDTQHKLLDKQAYGDEVTDLSFNDTQANLVPVKRARRTASRKPRKMETIALTREGSRGEYVDREEAKAGDRKSQ